MRSNLTFAAWSLLAGAGIPLIGVLNSGIARSVGNPFAATAAMFAIAVSKKSPATCGALLGSILSAYFCGLFCWPGLSVLAALLSA